MVPRIYAEMVANLIFVLMVQKKFLARTRLVKARLHVQYWKFRLSSWCMQLNHNSLCSRIAAYNSPHFFLDGLAGFIHMSQRHKITRHKIASVNWCLGWFKYAQKRKLNWRPFPHGIGRSGKCHMQNSILIQMFGFRWFVLDHWCDIGLYFENINKVCLVITLITANFS